MCRCQKGARIKSIIWLLFILFNSVSYASEKNILISVGKAMELYTEVSATYVGRDLYGNPTLYVRGGVSFDDKTSNQLIEVFEAEVGYHIPNYEWIQAGVQFKQPMYTDNNLLGLSITLKKSLDSDDTYFLYLKGDYSKYLKPNLGIGDYIKDDYNLEIGFEGFID